MRLQQRVSPGGPIPACLRPATKVTPPHSAPDAAQREANVALGLSTASDVILKRWNAFDRTSDSGDAAALRGTSSLHCLFWKQRRLYSATDRVRRVERGGGAAAQSIAGRRRVHWQKEVAVGGVHGRAGARTRTQTHSTHTQHVLHTVRTRSGASQE